MKKKILFCAVAVVLLAVGCNQTAPNKQGTDDTNLEQPARQQIQVTQKVEGQFGDKLFNFYADENKTALDLLNMSYKVEAKHYSGIGDMVTSIAGQKADDKHFWEFFVNGKSSNVGAGSYKPVNGDKLEWKLTVIK